MDLTSPVIILLIANAAGCFALTLHAALKKKVQGAVPYAVLAFLAGIFDLLLIFEITGSVIAGLTSLIRMGLTTLFGITTLIFYLEFTGNQRYLTKSTYTVLFLFFLGDLILLLTNDLHHLIFTGYHLESNILGIPMMIYDKGPFFTVQYRFVFLFGIIGAFFILTFYGRALPVYKKQILLVIVGSLILWLFEIFYVVSTKYSYPGIRITPMTYLLAAIIIYRGTFGFQLPQIMPVAKDMIMDIIQDAVLLIDENATILLANPAVDRLFGSGTIPMEGRKISGLISGDIINTLMTRRDQFFEFDHQEQTPEGKRCYHLQVSLIQLPGSEHTGHLLVIRDTTEMVLMHERNAEALRQLEHYVCQFSILNDQIRNPLAIMLCIAEQVGDYRMAPMIDQIIRVDDVIRQLDEQWLESEKVRSVLKKHYNFGDNPSHDDQRDTSIY